MKRKGAKAAAPQTVRACLSFVRALSTGDLEGATACFARDACLITPDATVVHGRERIRALLAQLVARRTEIKVELSTVIGGGDVILASERWRVRSGAGGEAPRVEQVLDSTLVLRQVEGEWKLAIAAPWGWGPSCP